MKLCGSLNEIRWVTRPGSQKLKPQGSRHVKVCFILYTLWVGSTKNALLLAKYNADLRALLAQCSSPPDRSPTKFQCLCRT